jgi:hypothetical protein
MKKPGLIRVEVWFDADEIKVLDRIKRREGLAYRATAVKVAVKIASRIKRAVKEEEVVT